MQYSSEVTSQIKKFPGRVPDLRGGEHPPPDLPGRGVLRSADHDPWGEIHPRDGGCRGGGDARAVQYF